MQITAATIILLELLIVVFLICVFLVFILRKKNRTIVQLSQQLIQKKKALKKAKAATAPTSDETDSAPPTGGKTYPEYLQDAINGTEFHFKNTSGKENIELNPKDHINQQAIALRHLFLQTEKNACIDEGLFSWQAIEEGLSKVGKAYLEVGGPVSTGEETAEPVEVPASETEADDLESLTVLADTSNEIPELNEEVTSLESETLDDDPTTALLSEISAMDEGLEESIDTVITPEEPIAEIEAESESLEPTAEATPEPVEEDPMADLLDAFGSISEASSDLSDVEAEPITNSDDQAISDDNSIDLATPESEIAELEKALFDTPLDVGIEANSSESPAVENLAAESELESLMEETPTIEEADDELNALEQALADSDELLAETIPQDDPAAVENSDTAPTAEDAEDEGIANIPADDIDSILAETANLEASLDDSGEEIAPQETTTEEAVPEENLTDDLSTEFDLSTEELNTNEVVSDAVADSAPDEGPSLDDIDDIDSLLEEVQEGELPSLEDRVKDEKPDPVLSDDQAELLAELLDEQVDEKADEKDKQEKEE